MKLKLNLAALLAACSLNSIAAVPPAEQLLSSDTLAVVTVPDWSKARAATDASPAGQLWQDPELKAFKDKFLNRLQETVVAPLEKELGVKLADFAEIAQGQVTLAFSFQETPGGGEPDAGWCLALDAKDKGEQLKTRLADLKKKWVDAGKPIKNEKIRGVEFSTFSVTGDDVTGVLRKVFPGAAEEDAEGKTNQVDLMIGQSDSLLLVGGRAKELEKVLARQSGGQIAPLADVAEFQGSQGMFRDSIWYGWMNLKPIFALVNKQLAAQSANAQAANPMGVRPDKVFAALGLDGIKTVSLSANSNVEGELVQFFLNVPQSVRKGLFKVFAFEPKTAAPPPFVPADAVGFNRVRFDGQKAWAALKAMVTEVSPEGAGFLQMALATVGKQQDPNFDVEKSLIGNLGDDVISYQKPPKEHSLEALNTPPSMVLIGSPNAEGLVQALRTVAGVAIPGTQLKEREFVGHKILSFPMPALPNNSGEKDRTLSLAAAKGYLAFATDNAILEEYLRGAENQPKSLSDTPGLSEASQKVGGMETGYWGYQNQAESMRATIETLKSDSSAFERLLSLSPLGKGGDGEAGGLKEWLDFSLLPAFDKISKYFSLSVYSVATTPEGLGFKFYAPTPPSLRK